MVIVLSACDKEFLEKSPIVGTTEENFYRNEADAIAAVNAAYAALQFQLSPAGQPRVIPTTTNIHPAVTPKVVIAGVPQIYTPGQDSLLLPKTVPAIDSPFIAGIPEVA